MSLAIYIYHQIAKKLIYAAYTGDSFTSATRHCGIYANGVRNSYEGGLEVHANNCSR